MKSHYGLSIIHVFSGPRLLLGLCWCRTNSLGALLPKAMSSGMCPEYRSIHCNGFQSFYNRKLFKGGFNLPLRLKEEKLGIGVVILGEREERFPRRGDAYGQPLRISRFILQRRQRKAFQAEEQHVQRRGRNRMKYLLLPNCKV